MTEKENGGRGVPAGAPVQRVLNALYQTSGHEPKKSPTGWLSHCPAHHDDSPSLSIAEASGGAVLLHCHAGCLTDDVVRAIGLDMADLFAQERAISHASRPARTIIAEYNYRDESGAVVIQVVRYEPKQFRQRRPNGNGRWSWSVKGVRPVPYHLDRIVTSPDEPIVVTEGEKDADNLARIGMLATCNAGGAGKWTADHAQYLAGRDVIVTPDNDDAGQKHAESVAASLYGLAASVRVLELPGLPPKGDVSDWIEVGGTKSTLCELASTVPRWIPPNARPWPELQALDQRDLPSFPVDGLPSALREWVAAESLATQTPPDLPALLGLATCSATIARRIVIQPDDRFREPTNLFVIVILGPANRKSPVFVDASRPLREVESELIESQRAEVARQTSERRQAQRQLELLEKKAAAGGGADAPKARSEAAELAAKLAEWIVPVTPRLLVDDITPEKLGMMLAEQGGRIASMSPEGGVFDLIAGKYSKSGTPQFEDYLKGHSGDDLRTDRVGRESVLVERPALTCAYAVQPVVIEALAKFPALRGRGLLGRFLYAMPDSWIGRRRVDAPPVPEAVAEGYERIVRRLARSSVEGTLRLEAQAAVEFHRWEAEIESMLADGGDLEAIRDWGGKLAGATLRLAAVLHAVEHAADDLLEHEVGVGTIRAAVRIARYLMPHADAALSMLNGRNDRAVNDAKYLLSWIRRHDFREFSKRDAHQHGKRRFTTSDDLAPVLDELTARGYIRPLASELPRPGRPPSTRFEVNPAAFQPEQDQGRTQNPQNDGVESQYRGIGNNGSAPADSSSAGLTSASPAIRLAREIVIV